MKKGYIILGPANSGKTLFVDTILSNYMKTKPNQVVWSSGRNDFSIADILRWSNRGESFDYLFIDDIHRDFKLEEYALDLMPDELTMHIKGKPAIKVSPVIILTSPMSYTDFKSLNSFHDIVQHYHIISMDGGDAASMMSFIINVQTRLNNL